MQREVRRGSKKRARIVAHGLKSKPSLPPHISGQSSTGSVLNWARRTMFPDMSYKELDALASAVPVGCDGLVCLPTFQGSRTPVTDPDGKGSFIGLTLGHGRAHIWRSIMEGVALGTLDCVSGLRSGGHAASEIVVAGGAARSQLWLQMHADAANARIVCTEFGDAPLLGGAILASVGAGVWGSVEEAVGRMVKVDRVVEPKEENVGKYEKLFGAYKELAKSVRPGVRMLKDIRGGDGGGGRISPR